MRTGVLLSMATAVHNKLPGTRRAAITCSELGYFGSAVMTSRLKRKLNDLGVDVSSSKANESFCLVSRLTPALERPTVNQLPR